MSDTLCVLFARPLTAERAARIGDCPPARAGSLGQAPWELRARSALVRIRVVASTGAFDGSFRRLSRGFGLAEALQ